jgi:hypothetical protein
MRDEISSQPNFDQTLLSVFDALNDRPIVYHKIYAKIVGSTSGGLAVSQLIYWSRAMNHCEFYKSNAELCEELGMGINEFKAAKKLILQTGIFTTEVRGVPATTYYKINLKVLFDLITKHSPQAPPTSWLKINQLEGTKSTNQLAENQPTITEMTTEITKEDNNNKPKAVGCAMAVSKKLSHVEPKSVVHATAKSKSRPEPKAEPTLEAQEPNGSVVVNCEINDLMKLVVGWAISRVMLETWAKQHGVGYVLQKIELTKFAIGLNRVRKPGAYLNKAIELDWQPPAPYEDEEAQNKPVEQTFPTHEENVAWYDKLVENEKLAVLSEAVCKNPYLEEHLKNVDTSVLDASFSGSTWFKMMMSNVGRAK